MKLLLSIGVYFALVFVLGVVVAWTAPRAGFELDVPEDDD